LAAPILDKGLRMSTQGQGDGGVYFSTLGPASYGLGSPQYEENIIVDCFGKERLEEYRGKHKLDLLLVYGIDPLMVQQAPGGRDNAKVVGKVMFEDFSLAHEDGTFYLRSDRLMGAYLLDPAHPPGGFCEAEERLEEERKRDSEVRKLLARVDKDKDANASEVRALHETIRARADAELGPGRGRTPLVSEEEEKPVVKPTSRRAVRASAVGGMMNSLARRRESLLQIFSGSPPPSPHSADAYYHGEVTSSPLSSREARSSSEEGTHQQLRLAAEEPASADALAALPAVHIPSEPAGGAVSAPTTLAGFRSHAEAAVAGRGDDCAEAPTSHTGCVDGPDEFPYEEGGRRRRRQR